MSEQLNNNIQNIKYLDSLPGPDTKSKIPEYFRITKSAKPTGTGNLFGADGASLNLKE